MKSKTRSLTLWVLVSLPLLVGVSKCGSSQEAEQQPAVQNAAPAEQPQAAEATAEAPPAANEGAPAGETQPAEGQSDSAAEGEE